jgi:hypothetical protein
MPRIHQCQRFFAKEAREAAKAQAKQHFQVAVGMPYAAFAKQAAANPSKPHAQNRRQKTRAHHPRLRKSPLRQGDGLYVSGNAAAAAVEVRVDNQHGNSGCLGLLHST